MMGFGSKQGAVQVRELSISGDIMAFRMCPRQYRYHTVLGLPRSDRDPLWASEFICGLEREAYQLWKGTGEVIKDRPSINRMCGDVNGYLGSQGMQSNPRAYEDDPDGTSSKLMNLRAHETVCFAMDHLFPLVSENDTIIRYRDGNIPFSITGSVGILDGDAVSKAGDDNILAQMIKDAVGDIPAGSEVLFEVRGTERPLDIDEGSNMDGHATYINALMGMRMSGDGTGATGDVIAGIILYLNELRLSKRAQRALQTYLMEGESILSDDELLMLADMEDGEQPSLDTRIRRCIRVVPYNQTASRRALNDMSRIGMDIIRAHQADEESPSEVDEHWPPGDYDSRRCKACDFRISCRSVPEDERVLIPGCIGGTGNDNPSMMAPRE